LGVLFHNSLSSALLFKLAHIKVIIGYQNDGRQFLLNFAPKIDRARHYINHYANLVNLYLDKPYTTLPKSVLQTQKQTSFSKTSQPTIALVLGSEKGHRGYPKDLSLALCELLQNSHYQILFLGDKEDAKTNLLYAKALPNSQNFSGETSLAEFIDIIADVDLLITIDTSAMHIAAATKTKFITLLGKGTSAFSIVQPKVDFGSYLYAGEDYIDDAAQIRAISPKMILTEIEKRLS
jgi:heptosyltransferase-2